MRQESQSGNLPVLRFVAMCVLSQSFLWHVGCRSCGESDLSNDCLERNVENFFDRLRLGVGPGGTSVGVWTVETPTTCLEVI